MTNWKWSLFFFGGGGVQNLSSHQYNFTPGFMTLTATVIKPSAYFKCVFAWHLTRPSHSDVDLHRLRALDRSIWPRPAPLRLLTPKNARGARKVWKVFSAHASASEGSVKWQQPRSEYCGGFLVCAIPFKEAKGNMNSFVRVSEEEIIPFWRFE